jgi:ABC-type transporter Mla subunit MlaD
VKFGIENKARLAFAALALLGVAAAIGWSTLADSRYRTYQIRTQDSVSGLIVDAPVEFHGVEVGRVKQVELTGPKSVSILLTIRKGAPVTSATVATITARGLATRGFTGYVYVALEDGGPQGMPLAAGPGETYPQLRSAASRSVNLDTAISQVNKNVQVMTDVLQAVLDEKTVASMKHSVNSLERVTRTLADNDRRLATIVANAEEASRQFRPLLGASNDTIRVLQTRVLPEAHQTFLQLRPLLDSSGDAVRALQTQVLPEAYQTLRQFRPLLDSSSDTVRVLQTQVLPEAYETLSDLNRLSGALDGAAAKINRDPSVLIRGAAAPPPGPGESR